MHITREMKLAAYEVLRQKTPWGIIEDCLRSISPNHELPFFDAYINGEFDDILDEEFMEVILGGK